MSIIPQNRPQCTRADVVAQFPAGTFKAGGLYVISARGYFSKMGQPGKNDRNKYDDMIGVLSDNVFVAFNGNADPASSKHPQGAPTILPGVYPVYQIDLHGGKYFAVCQRAGSVRVRRDKTGTTVHTGAFGINYHEGGNKSVGSEGCQTIPPGQFDEFMTVVIAEAIRIYGARNWHNGLITAAVCEWKW